MVLGNTLQKIKPEERNLREHAAFVRDAGSQYVIEGRDAVGGNKQEPLIVNAIDIAYFAAGIEFQVREIGL